MSNHPTIKQSLQALFACFPAPDSGSPEQAAAGFLMAVEGVSPEHVAASARRFIRGEVKRERNTFLPSAAEFAIECRRLRDETAAAHYVALPAPEKPKDDPAMRAKIAAMFANLARSIDPKRGAPDADYASAIDVELRCDPVRVTNASALIQAIEKRGG